MTRSHRILRAGLFLVCGLACGPACGPSRSAAFERTFAEGERAETAGRFDEAAHRFDEAARVATRPRDRNHAAYVAALTFVQAGDVREGSRRLEPIAAADPPTEHTAEAAFRLAQLRIAHGEPARGWKDLEALVLRFPNSGVAHPALRQLARHAEEQGGKRAELEYLRALEPKLDATELGPLVAYRAAVTLDDLGETAAAHDALLAVAARWPYPFGAFWDDALFRASELDEKLGRYAHAAEDLERMLAERETTTLVGTYQRPKYTPALLRLAYLYADRLRDHTRARAALHRLYADFTTSPMRDDALWFEAELWGADGDATHACRTLDLLVREFPDSRYVPCAVDRCVGITRSAKSKAPATCHAYLLRPGRLSSGRTTDESRLPKKIRGASAWGGAPTNLLR